MRRQTIINEINAIASGFDKYVETHNVDVDLSYLIRKIKALAELPCNHENSRVVRDGMTGMIGTVICNDCGYERDWGAY